MRSSPAASGLPRANPGRIIQDARGEVPALRSPTCWPAQMAIPPHGEITGMLQSLSRGDPTAFDRLFPLVYGELRRVAHGQLARERDDHTLDSVALVNEAYLRLVASPVECQNRAHFFAVAARAMRTILIDYARARLATKRGSGASVIPLDEATVLFSEDRAEHLVAR